ncbi:MAG: ABC transporter permease [Deltaproteobacteria bacterium]|nr:ABC transporter permease [Deltaproteobacteria bacterium]
MALVKIAWRSIWRNRRRTLITLSSIVLCLAIAVFFIAAQHGVYDRLVDEAVRMQSGHLCVEHAEYIEAPAIDLVVRDVSALRKRIERIHGVESTKALVIGQGVAKSASGSVGVAVLGVEPEVEMRSSPLARKIVRGSYLAEEDGASAVVGAELVKKLKLDIGKKLVISSNDMGGDLVEEQLRVKGIFETGSTEVDAYVIQIPLGFARKLYGMGDGLSGEATRLGIVLADADERGEVMDGVAGLLAGEQAVRTWEEVMPDLAAFIEMDVVSNYIFQGIILFLILFTIFNTLLMSVLERKREFAVLLALGTSNGRIKIQILLESAFIALLGVAFGLLVGGLVTGYFQAEGIDLSSLMEEGMSISGFAMDMVMYPALTAELLAVLGAVVFAATLLMSLYPMGQIKRIPVADVLR